MTDVQSATIHLGEAVTGVAARITIHLDAPRAHVRIRDPRRLGRAEARFAGQSWTAKHYWAEGTEEDRVTTYQFDEALPAGDVELVVPFE